MKETIIVSDNIPIESKKLYSAWLSSKEHSLFTGSKAVVSNGLNRTFTAWDGYISGKNLILEANKRIVQSWRATDFPKEQDDSTLEILFEPDKSGTKLTLIHSDIPEGQGKEFADGWKKFYFEPMKKYFVK